MIVSDVPAGNQINYRATKPIMGLPDEEETDGGLELGDLRDLSISNEADPVNYDVRFKAAFHVYFPFCINVDYSSSFD